MKEQKDNHQNHEKHQQDTSNKENQLHNSSEEQNVVSEEQAKENEEETEIQKLQERYNELNDSYLRLGADFDNYRKRTMREKADLIKNAGERIILDFLPIVDNFERAIESMEKTEDVNAVKEGVVLIYQQILKMLQQNGVKVIETNNLAFDTEFHEAITTIPAPSAELKDKIIDCTTKGYTMNEKVIRHAKVVVGQ